MIIYITMAFCTLILALFVFRFILEYYGSFKAWFTDFIPINLFICYIVVAPFLASILFIPYKTTTINTTTNNLTCTITHMESNANSINKVYAIKPNNEGVSINVNDSTYATLKIDDTINIKEVITEEQFCAICYKTNIIRYTYILDNE